MHLCQSKCTFVHLLPKILLTFCLHGNWPKDLSGAIRLFPKSLNQLYALLSCGYAKKFQLMFPAWPQPPPAVPGSRAAEHAYPSRPAFATSCCSRGEWPSGRPFDIRVFAWSEQDICMCWTQCSNAAPVHGCTKRALPRLRHGWRKKACLRRMFWGPVGTRVMSIELIHWFVTSHQFLNKPQDSYLLFW